MGLFQKIKDARASFQSNYVRPGHYIARIERVKQAKTRKDEDFIAIEMKCIVVIDNDSGRGHKVGEDMSHLLMAKNDSSIGNFKRFVMNVMEASEEEVTEEACEHIVSDNQPLCGLFAEVFAKEIVTKKGTPFTRIDYKRAVPKEDVKRLMSEEAKRLFPNI